MKKLLLLVVIALLMRGAARAEEDMAYVIKVTPTLAYLDVGQTTGAMVGEMYLIVREDGGRYIQVGEVQLVRIDANFSIGEIIGIAEGEAVEVLDRAVARSDWDAMGEMHLVPRGYDRAGVYLGAGAGFHQLNWDPPGSTDDSANKIGFNIVAGVQSPKTMNLVLEVGYQKVIKFDDLLDVSNIRTYLGFGRAF